MLPVRVTEGRTGRCKGRSVREAFHRAAFSEHCLLSKSENGKVQAILKGRSLGAWEYVLLHFGRHSQQLILIHVCDDRTRYLLMYHTTLKPSACLNFLIDGTGPAKFFMVLKGSPRCRVNGNQIFEER